MIGFERGVLVAGCVAVAGVAFAASACGGDKAEDKGAPPSVSDLTLNPTTIGVATPVNVTATFKFTDADADVTQVAASLGSGGQTTALGPTALQGAQGQTSAPASLALIVQAPAAGTLTVQIWAIDSKGNESNHLSGTLTAQ